jgi:hypothetical protein
MWCSWQVNDGIPLGADIYAREKDNLKIEVASGLDLKLHVAIQLLRPKCAGDVMYVGMVIRGISECPASYISTVHIIVLSPNRAMIR